MFEKLRKLVEGNAKELETWPCDPLVIVDEGGDVIFAKPAIVHYAPGAERYEDGPGEVLDAASGEVVIKFTLEKIQHRDAFGILGPYGVFVPWGENGVTIFGKDFEGHPITIYTATHADSYLSQVGLGEPPAEEPAIDA